MAIAGGSWEQGLSQEVDVAMRELFKAYDLADTGELSRPEFLKIEMRLCYEEGGIFHEEAETAKLTLADRDRGGTLDFEEFRERQLLYYAELYLTTPEVVDDVYLRVQKAFAERAKMGPRYHAGIRQVLKRIFQLYDVSGDGRLTPEEWIAAQKVVALEISDDIDESWIDEAAFAAADTNNDGVLELDEFLESSFQMFEGVKRRMDAILVTLQRVVTVLEQQREKKHKETIKLEIMCQVAENPQEGTRPPFQPPSKSFQDEPTEDQPDKNADKWKISGEIRLPTTLSISDEIVATLRLALKLPADTWMSAYYLGPSGTSFRAPKWIRGEKPGEGNVKEALEYLTKASAEPKIYIKNVRKRPSKLIRQPRAFLEEREALLAKRTGQCWGLDWETQLCGDGEDCPPRPLVISLGEALVIEVPETDEGGEYRYVASIYMDGTDVLSKPVDETLLPKVKKSKKKAAGADPDPLVQMTFVSLKEGKCVLFVDVSWEDQEEKLATTHKLTAPCSENTVARIGPIEVEVQKAPPAGAAKPAAAGALLWWNGDKWTAKKGPKKKKKGK